ncbi:hypothetical protein EYZ11_004108 [Aspergillus tanneri]|uniref:Uncharacterized protein n=1 Tax=Aspergillus tanneri TaxID=1220188 RepID=A0A4S3JS90_9EURO|nr:uncharacterized protein ATNIH1004_005766 [Aspergillus tanneri]KAA8647083.1 hypothetical protein ATNIH1004_005766 [Aspergillus tanneri]THC96411.1 hypothetical protein EYZ11_004108 [Aspergillus tanneri]
MRIFSALSGLLLAGAAFARNLSNSNSTCSPQSSDVKVVQYGWALQYLAERYYSSQPLNQTYLNSATNSTRANYYSNFQGILRQNRLGVRAVQQLGSKVPGYNNPRCNFTFPPVRDGASWVRNALQLEQTLTGAFIGLAGYSQAPEVSFLVARLAAEHSGFSHYIASQQRSVVYPANSTTLLPAYAPDQVLKSGNRTGRLGTYLRNCVSAPSPPCGNLTIGPLIGSNSTNSTNSTSDGSNSSLLAGFTRKYF